MAMSVVLVPCKQCKTKVPYTDLRRNKEGLYVCGNCLNYGFQGIPKLRSTTETRDPLSSKVVQVSRKEERIPYVCNSCKFSFSKPLGSEDKNCPNCGKDFNVSRKQNASELLRDVDSMFGE